MNATVTEARDCARLALAAARAERVGTRANQSAFLTFRRAAQINNGLYAIAYAAGVDSAIKAHTIAGHMLTQRADRSTRYGW